MVSKGNIVIVGDLYGSVHAGAYDNRDAYIVALSMQPKRLCIGDIEAKRQLISQESLNVRGPKDCCSRRGTHLLRSIDRLNAHTKRQEEYTA